jgi:alpha-L-rhamnosidase
MKNISRLISIFILAFASMQMQASKVQVTHLLTEGLESPLGIDTTMPRLSWQSLCDKNGTVQTAYRIIVASSMEKLDKDEGDLWDTGKVNSDESIWIKYAGKTLKDNDRTFWKVKVFTNNGTSDWSAASSFSIGLLNESHWRGQWIGLNRLMPGENSDYHTRLAARYLRKEISLKPVAVKRATAYVVSLGLYELYINGEKMGKDVLTPAPSDFRKTIYYNTYDVTSYLKSHSAIGVVLGNGRAFPMRQNKAYKIPTFGLPTCRLNIIVEYADGTMQTIVTDDSWKLTTDGPIRANNEYDGEEYDARMEMKGWNDVDFDDSQWMKVERTAVPQGTPCAQMTPGMCVGEDIKPLSVKPLNNSFIIDFGQNMAGWVRMNVRGNAGDSIKLTFAERLNSDGSLYRANLRDARSEDIYICNGKENGTTWNPTFVTHGFRYVQVDGLKNPSVNDFDAFPVGDRMETTGSFACSDTILNKVYRNAVWGVRSNYKGMPVDCPQRNERQPWLGDRAVGSLGESYMFSNERLYTKWMRDICESQRADGNIPDVAPAFWSYYSDDVTWPATLPFICDMIYDQFGNMKVVADCYPSIKKWINHIVTEYSSDGIITRDKYGDWCVPPESLELIHSKDSTRITDGALLSTAYSIRVMQLMNKFALLQGLNDDATQWKQREESMKEAFNKKFLTVKRGTSLVPGHPLYPDSIYYGNNTATANLLAVAFGIVPEDCKAEVVKNIVTNIITKNNGHVSCGVIGISWLMRTLSDNGFADVAYLLATNKTYPSWGYMAENGATTIWELWNGDKANPQMNSGNHVMLLGDLLTWCYQNLAGIRNGDGSAAYKHIIMKPNFEIEDCSNVDASFCSPYGMIVSKWKKTLEKLVWNVQIPVNTTADVYLPDGNVKHIGSGTYTFNADIKSKSPAVIGDEFLYEHATFPQCHASTITELSNGDLVAAYFGGKHENNPDVCIYVSRKPKGSDHWLEPQLAADGVFELGTPDADLAGISAETTPANVGPIKYMKSTVKDLTSLRRKACWNPVLFTMPDGEILLFYKIGSKVQDWTGWLVRSKDGGKTWSPREALPKGFLGPIKNKPELIGDRLICPSSTEKGGWRIHFEIYNTKTKTWKYVDPVDGEMVQLTQDMGKNDEKHPVECIQPSILKLKDGRLQVLCRSRNGKIATSFSSDNGDTWTKVTLLDVPNNQSGTDAVTLKDGRHVLIYNDFGTLPGTSKGVRTPLSIAISDDGTHWRHVLTLENSPISQYSYPSIIQGRDGTLHAVYTWRRLRVAYKHIDLNLIK